MERNRALDGVRGLAILVVIAHNAAWAVHSGSSFPTKLVLAATATGWTGVQLFFVLSGFLITRILLEAKGTPGYFRTFYVRRTLRIFPPYYAFLALVAVVGPLVVASPGWVDRLHANQGWYWTYLSNWVIPFGHDVPGLSHLWSLAVEEQFYVVWPLVVAVCSTAAFRGVTLGLILLTPFVRWGLLAAGLPDNTPYEFTIARWDALAAGALLALLWREPAYRHTLARLMQAVLVVAGGLLLALVVRQHGFHAQEWPVVIVGQSLVALLSMVLVHAAIAAGGGPAGAVRGMLESSPLVLLGKYSYAMYIFHFPIQFIAQRALGDAINGPDDHWRLVRLILWLAGVIVVSLVAARFSWVLLERPMLRLKERLAPAVRPVTH